MTPEEASRPATQAELYAVRSELRTEIRDSRDKLAVEIVRSAARTDARIDALQAAMLSMRSEIMTFLDQNARRMEALVNGLTIHGQTLTEHDRRLKRLEGRA